MMGEGGGNGDFDFFGEFLGFTPKNTYVYYYNGAFLSFFIAENSGSISETGLIIARVLMAKIRYVCS